jgi:hypothetical protein
LAADEKHRIFEQLMELFTQTAEAFAKSLVDDPTAHRPDPKFGGVAGGQKYRIHSEACFFCCFLLFL